MPISPTPPPQLVRLLDEAAAVEPTERGRFEAPIARFGTDAIEPLLAWVARSHDSEFAVAVLERIGQEIPAAASPALERAAELDPSVAQLASETITSIAPRRRSRLTRS